MRDRRGQEICPGDEVLVHLTLGDYYGIVHHVSEGWVYVGGVSLWGNELGGMFPENVTVIESADIDIGL